MLVLFVHDLTRRRKKAEIVIYSKKKQSPWLLAHTTTATSAIGDIILSWRSLLAAVRCWTWELTHF